MKKLILVLTAGLILLAQNISAQDKLERSFYFDIGGGTGSVSYGEELDDLMKILDGSGADRTTIYADVGVGFAATEKLYIILSSAAFADGLYYQNESIIMTSVLAGAGIRYYPFVTGLQLGAEVGIGSLTVEVTGEETVESDPEIGTKFTVAYDFDSTKTGPALQIGGSLLSSFVEDETILGAAVFAKLVIK